MANPISFLRRNRSVHAARRHPGRLFADIYEGNIGYNAQAYRAAGRPFIVLKASEGAGHVDSLHAIRCEDSHKTGCPVGHYHYLDSGVDPEAQARHFWEVVRPHFLERWPTGRGHDAMRLSHTDFLIVDVETGGPPTRQHLLAFESELYRVSHGRHLIGYSGKSFLLEHDLNLSGGGNKWWVADYPFFPGNIGRGRVLWGHQFSDNEHIVGVKPPTDASVLSAPTSIRYWDAQFV